MTQPTITPTPPSSMDTETFKLLVINETAKQIQKNVQYAFFGGFGWGVFACVAIRLLVK